MQTPASRASFLRRLLRRLRRFNASASLVIDPASLASEPAAPRLVLGPARIIALRLPRRTPTRHP